MEEEQAASCVSWGARISIRERHDKSDCPTWAKPVAHDTRFLLSLLRRHSGRGLFLLRRMRPRQTGGTPLPRL
jgi:hypothetical protein